eukprot:scaffold7236_cov163-Ochromonas_danica.AAC.3
MDNDGCDSPSMLKCMTGPGAYLNICHFARDKGKVPFHVMSLSYANALKFFYRMITLDLTDKGHEHLAMTQR